MCRIPVPPLVLLGLFLLVPPSGVAQEVGEWTGEGELGASVFFGNTDQTTVTTRAATSRADSTLEFSAQASFNYGEATDELGDDFVVKRSWDVAADLDYHPFARVSPFIFGKMESSFERRIDFRYSGGAGGKLTAVRDERTRLDLSLAALAEQTLVSEEAVDGDETLARWSVRLRGQRSLSGERITFSTENSYRPVIDDPGSFVLESRSSFSFVLTDAVSLKLSFVDTYDSEATARGADTNNDGQIFFSVLSTF